MQKYNADELMELLSARLAHGMYVEGEGPVCTDSRRLKEGDWFVALCGQSFDGHDFLGDAYSAGARGAIVEERLQYSLGNKTFPLLAVDNTFTALALLAREQKCKSVPPVVAISFHGSREETNRLFDFTRAQVEERGRAALQYVEGNSAECLDRYINLEPDTIYLVCIPSLSNFSNNAPDLDFEQDWELLLNTLTPEILIVCEQTYEPQDSPGAAWKNYQSRIVTTSETALCSNETNDLALKWQLNPSHAGAILAALDQEFPRIKVK